MEIRPFNELELRVHGAKRSGQHAIIVWLAHHFKPQQVTFLNNPSRQSCPFLTHESSEWITNRYSPFCRDQNAEHRACLVYNFEDQLLRGLVQGIDRKRVGASSRQFDLLILRDPLNLMASRYRYDHSSIPVQRTADIWLDHAFEFIGRTKHLPYLLPVNYNAWFTDIHYRRRLSEGLGLHFSDAGLEYVPHNGHGSTFDKLRFDGCAQRMEVLSRWKQCAGDPSFRKIFRGHHGIREISEEIFGEIPGSDMLFDS